MSLVSIQDLGMEEGKILIREARKAIKKKLGLIKNNENEQNYNEKLNKKGLAFVTLETYYGSTTSLRGCIGYVEAVAPLIDIVRNAAVAAAFSDPRFPPITEAEIDNILIEITILTKPEEIIVENRKDLPRIIKVGRDGLIVEKGILYSGLLLPQVPKEYCWDEETFLAETCIKAGLAPDCWLDNKVKIKKFEGKIFREKYPNSEEIEVIDPSDVKCKKAELLE
ncbi:TIGR00296 family protein [Acidianus sulfidivorans JP7]|uniref:Protein DFR86_07060 n=1 Tax=Acidianus sulfidivorans JP7 TaxID=619593 RepID=A0A2U9IMT3_9CREN|nr:TIGR00296 family protein [Acidianus sulfidivorans]AWR97332.1 TIGR00296 family protein [Acidianus sulfidivorans JP7]